MIKKYIPLIALMLAAFLVWYIKSHQRGDYTLQSHTEQGYYSKGNDTILAVNRNLPEGFNRLASHIIYSRHARCRMDCRHIDEQEIKEILKNGQVNERKIETDDRGTTYPLEGFSEGHHLRIVVAPKGLDAIEVVTCIDLDTDWKCDCD